MRKANIVKESRDFQEIIEQGTCHKNRNFVLYYRKNHENRYRFGISVGKKIGNAVVRNAYKRKLRNIIDHHKNIYPNDRDYIIILRKNCLNSSYQELEKSYLELFQKVDRNMKEII